MKFLERKLNVLLFVIVTFLTGCQEIPDPRLFTENKLALNSLKEKNFGESRDHFISALQFDPFRPEVHTNLGLIFQLSKDPDKALLSFKKAEELSADSGLQFLNRYNQGQLLAAQKKIDEALSAYQRALELNPNSIETKVNIELLIQNQQQQQGQGEGQSKNDDKNKDQKKDQKQGEGQDQKKDPNQGQERKQSQKYKPREFKGELNQSDVNKILGEIKSQEQRIRAQYNKNESKDKPREKDW